jgi:membrane protein DedA with SNARE-associated domain
MEHLIALYGYIVIAVGTFFEGETILLVGAFLAHQKYLNLYFVILSAFTGSFAGDQLYYFIGRSNSGFVRKKFHKSQDRIERFQLLLKKYDILIILGFRFVYGLRTIAPFVIGMSGIPVLKFIILNFASAVLWAISIGLLGYYFGHTVEIIIGDIKKIEIVFSVIAVLIIIILVVRKIVRRRNLDKI